MLDHEPNGSGSGLEPTHESTTDSSATTAPRRRRAASRPAGQPSAEASAAATAGSAESGAAESAKADSGAQAAPAAKRTRKAPAKKTAKKSAPAPAAEPVVSASTAEQAAPAEPAAVEVEAEVVTAAPAKKAARKTTPRRRTRGGDAPAAETTPAEAAAAETAVAETAAEAPTQQAAAAPAPEPEPAEPATGAATRGRRTRKRVSAPVQTVVAEAQVVPVAPPTVDPELAEDAEEDAETAALEAAAIESTWVDDLASEDVEFDRNGLGDEGEDTSAAARARASVAPPRPGALIFQAPVVTEPPRRTRATAPQSAPKQQPASGASAEPAQQPVAAAATGSAAPGSGAAGTSGAGSADDEHGSDRDSRRRRKRRGRGDQPADAVAASAQPAADTADGDADEQGHADTFGAAGGDSADGSSRRRRRRRRRQTAEDLAAGGTEVDDPPNTVVRIREPREPREPRERRSRLTEPDSVRTGDDVLGVRGSVRLAAKQQRRRDGRSTRSRRAPIVSEAEFLARRESVERVMVVRQAANRTQIGVLEDGVLVEHYVNRESSVSYVGNVYLGKVQNVLPSMEAAFVDINKGRNAVLYAGEVDFGAAGLAGQPKRIESALKSGQPVLVQVTKDPIGHKGARLTSQISLPGRYLVYVPEGTMTGISRKLPDNERTRLKQILKKVVPEDGGVIVRTAAEGASEEELASDVERLVAQWEEIERRSRTANAPALLYGEPDLTVRVIRDIFNEDFSKLIVSGDEAHKTIHEYLSGVAPELAERLQQWTSDTDVFSVYRVDEQLAKGLDRKVWLPSGGSLVIDRTEAMVVIDVNTGKFTGQGSNSLEETVTRNNLEAAEEIVRQLRLRDLGGIIVIDFIDMVLESNRDLVLRRLLECLGRDRTKHQVAEVTSLGLVQMTRKRVGQGLLEAFSETCDHCNGRGILVHMDPVDAHGRKSNDRTGTANGSNGSNGGQSHDHHEHDDDREDGASAQGAATATGTPHVGGGSAADSRANRRRRRKGKHLDGDGTDAPGTAADSDEDVAPINLKAHAEDPDAVHAAEDLSEALLDTGRPRKRRRAASRPAGPAGAQQAAAEAS